MKNVNQTGIASDYNPEALLDDREDEPKLPGGGEIPRYEDNPAVNIALVFGETEEGRAALQKLSAKIILDFDTAWEASKGHRERAARVWSYFSASIPRTWKPHEYAADVNLPLVLENISRLAWRAFQEVFGDFSAIVDVAPNGVEENELEVAAKRTLYDNWQFCQQFTEFPREMHVAMLEHYLIGDWVTVSSWDTRLERNLHETLGPDDYVVPWVNRSTSIDYSDVPFFCRILHLYAHDIEEHAFEWHNVEVCKTNKPSWSDDPEQVVSGTVQTHTGVGTESTQPGAPRKVLQYEGWLAVPYQAKQRYCKAIVDYLSGEVFWLSFLEEEDTADRQRYDRDLEELETYREAKMEWAAGLAPEEPMPPAWLSPEDSEEEATPPPPKRKPLHLRAHGVCIEPIKGPYGLGFGIIIMAYNECANGTFDAFLDQVMGATMDAWLTTDRRLASQKELTLAPGSVTLISGVAPSELKDAIQAVPRGEPNPLAAQIVQMMSDAAQRASHASDVMSGRPGKSGESFKGQNERLEQAMSMLSVSASKFVPAFEQIARNNAKLNSIHLAEEEFFMVTRVIPMPMGMANVGMQSIAREFYAMPYAVRMRADARFISKQQRVAEADQMVGLVNSHPALASNQELVRYVLVKAFEARGQWDLVGIIRKGWQQQDAMAAAAPPMLPGPPGGAPSPGAGPVPGSGPGPDVPPVQQKPPTQPETPPQPPAPPAG